LQDSTMTFLDMQKTLITLVVAFPSDSLLNNASGYIFWTMEMRLLRI
jgi:hypothetical protein